MIVHVTKTEHGSTTGLNDILFVAGRNYEMPDDLAEVFLREGWAVPFVPDPTEDPLSAPRRKRVLDATGDSVEPVTAPEFVELSEPVPAEAEAPSPAIVSRGKRPGRPAKAR